MPLKILIADDEYYIRQRVKKIIPWEELQMELAGEADNGADVLDFLEHEGVDILILDIKMPHKSGLDVAHYVHQNRRDIQIILLSGYSDFEYAREAMHFGVSEYLVKPVDKTSLEKALCNCAEKIADKRESRTAREEYELSLAKLDFYHYLNSEEGVDRLFGKYPQYHSYTHTQLAEIFAADNIGLAIRKITRLLEAHAVPFYYYKEDEYSFTVQIFLNLKNRDESMAQTNGTAKLFQEFVRLYPGYLFVLTGTPTPVSQGLRENCQTLKQGLYQRYFHPVKTVLALDEQMRAPVNKKTLSQIRTNLLYRLNSKDIDAFTGYINQLFEGLKIQQSASALYLVLTEIFITYQIHYDNQPSGHSITDFVKTLMDEEYRIDRLKDAVISFGMECSSQNEALPSDVVLSQKLMAYIQEHYRETDLSVSGLAARFQLNASYIGGIFKKITGQSLVQYITSVRMEKARELLERKEYKISDIAHMVGYTDVFYYSKRFKKMYGCSPREYAARQSKNT